MSLIKLLKEVSNEEDLFEKQLKDVAIKNRNINVEDIEIDRLKQKLRSSQLDKKTYPFIGHLYANSLAGGMESDMRIFEAILDLFRRFRNRVITSDDYPRIELEDINTYDKLRKRLEEWKYIRYWQKNTNPTPTLSSMSWDKAVDEASQMEI